MNNKLNRGRKKAVVSSLGTVYCKTFCLNGMSSNKDIRGKIVALQKDFKTIISEFMLF